MHFSPDLNNRISTIHFEANPADKIEELIHLGEAGLNIKFNDTTQIVEHCYGSFHIAQLICQTVCINKGIIESQERKTEIVFSYPEVMAHLSEEFSRSYFEAARIFATGPRLRREGRAPYLHILKWLSESETWSLQLSVAIQQHPEQKAGVTQVVEKGFLSDFLNKQASINSLIHFDSTSRILSVEDPKFMFYLKTINWNNFAKDIGYLQLVESTTYDYALSFAGTERRIAEKIFSRLDSLEIAVFYDKNEQADILSQNVEEYLYPIYSSKAAYVIPLLSRNYPNRVWTRFESKAFKTRFGENAVIPIWFSDVNEATFDISKDYGGMTFRVDKDEDEEIDSIVDVLVKKIEKYRCQ